MQTTVASAAPVCPKCGSAMYDNRATKRNPKAPDFKCKQYRVCDGVVWPARERSDNPEPVTEPGMYRDAEGTLYRVQKARETGNLYAKALTPIGGRRLTETDDVVGFEFTYAPGAFRALRASSRLTLEEARAFGIRYGICCVCGRLLKDADSVAAGIGPICATNV